MNYEVMIYWSNEDGCFIAEVPELKSLMAHGDTEKEALENAQEAIKLWLTVAKEDCKEIVSTKNLINDPMGKLYL